MLTDSACAYYKHGFNCAEAMLLAINDEYKLHLPRESIRLAAGFGNGMGKESVCGAMTGAIAGLGAMLVQSSDKQTPGFSALCAAWANTFEKDLGSDLCSDLKPRFKTAAQGCLETVRRTAQSFERFMQVHGLPAEL